MSEQADPADKAIRANILESMVEAALQGHELSAWEEGEHAGTFYATCERCGRSVYVSATTIRSMMAPRCPVRGTVPRIMSNLRAAAHLGDRTRFEQAFHTLLAHYSDLTYRQISASPAELVDQAWDSLPEEHRKKVNQLRRLLEQNSGDPEA